MKAIIDGKLYNTETAERIFGFQRKVRGSAVSGNPDYYFIYTHDFGMYKTKKGAYFECDEDAGTINVSSEEEVKRILQLINPDEYIDLFGEVEEA